MPEGLTVAVVGDGLVGERLVAELRRRDFPLKELRVLARSARRATPAGGALEGGAGRRGGELRRRDFPLKGLRVLARSARRATLAGETFEVGVAEPEAFEGVDLALFAGTEGEKGAAVQLAREAISRGAIVVDNGSDFRLDPEVPPAGPAANAGATG